MILIAENIIKSYGKKEVLSGVDLALPEGSLSGIVGENGSGKSTLLKIIVGDLKPDGGNVKVNGKLGYCPQKALLFPELTPDEHFQYFAAAYGMKKGNLEEQKNELTTHFNYKKYLTEKVKNLSGGTQQKLNLSLALLHQPDMLILDEPYNGFDWDTYLRFWDYSGKLLKKKCSIIIVTHLLAEKERFDRIFNLKNGKLV